MRKFRILIVFFILIALMTGCSQDTYIRSLENEIDSLNEEIEELALEKTASNTNIES